MERAWLGQIAAQVLMIALLAAAAPMGAHALGADDIAVLNQRVSELYGAGKYAEAIPLAEKSLDLICRPKGENRLDTVTRIGWLAVLYQSQDRYAQAEPLYKRARSQIRTRPNFKGPSRPAH